MLNKWKALLLLSMILASGCWPKIVAPTIPNSEKTSLSVNSDRDLEEKTGEVEPQVGQV